MSVLVNIIVLNTLNFLGNISFRFLLKIGGLPKFGFGLKSLFRSFFNHHDKNA